MKAVLRTCGEDRATSVGYVGQKKGTAFDRSTSGYEDKFVPGEVSGLSLRSTGAGAAAGMGGVLLLTDATCGGDITLRRRGVSPVMTRAPSFLLVRSRPLSRGDRAAVLGRRVLSTHHMLYTFARHALGMQGYTVLEPGGREPRCARARVCSSLPLEGREAER